MEADGRCRSVPGPRIDRVERTAMAVQPLACSPYYGVLDALDRENHSDHKVAMINEIDMLSCERLRAAATAQGRPRPSYTALVMKALAETLRRHPYANRIVLPGLFRPRLYQLTAVDISMAVERDGGGHDQAVYADTVRDADAKDLGAITAELTGIARATPETHPRWRQFRRLVERTPGWFARTVVGLPRLLPGLWVEHRGGAAFISSPAKYGVDCLVGTWPYPISLSFGLVKPRPVAVEGRVEVRPTMNLILSFDRRVMAGAPAARFFRTLSDQLEDAEHCLAADAGGPARPGAAA